LSSCDVLVDPSLYQAFGRPGLEAMACGTSCVLTPEGGVASYARHDENCLLVAPGDPGAMAKAILRLLDDPALRRRLRDGGRRTAKRFCHTEEARRHLTLYRQWLAAREGETGTRAAAAPVGPAWSPEPSTLPASYAGLDPTVTRDLLDGKYAFLDAGCAAGGSIVHCEKRFGRSPGLGLDWYGGDLDRARQSGLAVAQCDLLTVELPPGCVGFSSMLDFLEHLPDQDAARRVIERFARASRDFLFIRHPSFEDIAYLAGLGLKLGWTDWTGHPNMMRLEDFHRLFRELDLREYEIYPELPLLDSSHEAILPLRAPADAQSYDESAHGPKPYVEFDRVVYGKYDIFVRLNASLTDAEWRRITNLKGWESELEADGHGPLAASRG
jgi:hypothetical protein